MQYARISTVLVVLTVVLAGCSGGGVTDGGDTDGNPADTPGTDAPATDGSTAGTATTGGPPTDESLSLTAPDTRLREAGSFATEWSYTVTEADGTTSSLTQRYRVDLEENRSLQRFRTTGPDSSLDVETFVADGTSYTRYGDGDQVQYVSSDQPASVFETATGRASGFTADLESDASFVGTETYDGVTVSRYEYDNTAEWQAYGGSLFGSENVSVTEFTVAVLVDRDGVARLTMWTLSGEADDGTPVSAAWRYSVTDIGSTTVEDPDWLADAQA